MQLLHAGLQNGENTPLIEGRRHEKVTGRQSDDGNVEIESTHIFEASRQAQLEYRENFARYKS